MTARGPSGASITAACSGGRLGQPRAPAPAVPACTCPHAHSSRPHRHSAASGANPRRLESTKARCSWRNGRGRKRAGAGWPARLAADHGWLGRRKPQPFGMTELGTGLRSEWPGTASVGGWDAVEVDALGRRLPDQLAAERRGPPGGRRSRRWRGAGSSRSSSASLRFLRVHGSAAAACEGGDRAVGRGLERLREPGLVVLEQLVHPRVGGRRTGPCAGSRRASGSASISRSEPGTG